MQASEIMCTGNCTEGSKVDGARGSEQPAQRAVNPSLSASIRDSYSILQTIAIESLPTGCPKSRSPIASRSALGAKCMYRRVMLSVE